MNLPVEKVVKFLPLAIAAAYFMFLIATWQRFLRTQAEMKAKVDKALDEWLAQQAKPAE